jgi:hypothetical protein
VRTKLSTIIRNSSRYADMLTAQHWIELVAALQSFGPVRRISCRSGRFEWF